MSDVGNLDHHVQHLLLERSGGRLAGRQARVVPRYPPLYFASKAENSHVHFRGEEFGAASNSSAAVVGQSVGLATAHGQALGFTSGPHRGVDWG